MDVEDIILSPEAVFRALSMIREKEILKRHKYSIYQGQDGKWYTYYGVKALYALMKMAKNDVWPDWRFGDNDCNVWSLFHIIHITKES